MRNRTFTLLERLGSAGRLAYWREHHWRELGGGERRCRAIPGSGR